MKLHDSFYKLCRTRSTRVTLMERLTSCLATGNLARRMKATCSLSSFGATTFLSSLYLIKSSRLLKKQIAPFAPDLCVLAGYMLIVSKELCLKYDMINLHPAPPGGPTGTWQEVMLTLIQNQADTAGAMIHLATPELDRGPVVSYCLFSIKGNPFAEYWRKGDKDMLFRLIRQHELFREFPLIILTLQALSRGQVGIKDRRVINAQGKPINGYNLSSSIDEEVKKNLR
jgi:folate-dependent phosphoribosylglycinamide formyltransferase PurN